MIVRRVLSMISVLALVGPRVEAWPAETMTAIGRDARRLLPPTLSRLLAERETELQQGLVRAPESVVQALAEDLPEGVLRPATLALIEGEVDEVVSLLREGRVNEGLARLGALLRVTADLSDPVLTSGPEGWPAGLAREYYALFAANLDRMPVVLDDPMALQLSRGQLAPYWRSMVARSREQASTIRAELLRGGRVVSHTRLDYRSPAWAVASLAYSRAVTATAASWLVVWREANGDTTRMRLPPRQAPGGNPSAGTPTTKGAADGSPAQGLSTEGETP